MDNLIYQGKEYLIGKAPNEKSCEGCAFDMNECTAPNKLFEICSKDDIIYLDVTNAKSCQQEIKFDQK